jgi:WD40 repeat protein
MGVLRGHDSEVRMAAFSRDGKRLFTATTTEIRIWEVRTGKQLKRIPACARWQNDQVTFSGDEKWFVSDPETEPKIAPNGQFIMARIRLWEVKTAKEVRSFDIARTTAQIVGQYLDFFAIGKGSDAIVGTALSHDGKWVAAGTERGEVHLWNGATGKKVRTFGRWRDLGAIPVGFSRDGKWLVTSSLTLVGTKGCWVVRVWDVVTGKEKHAIAGKVFDSSLIGSNRFAPSLTDDGKWLIWTTGAEETTVRIWEVATGKEVRAFAGHKKAVTHGWVSGDKKLLATYDRGGSVRLWDMATGKELRVIEVRTWVDRLWRSENFQVHVSKDAKLLVTWTPSRLTLWDLEKGRAIRSMWR